MRARERPTRGAVVESSGGPSDRVVARRTIRGRKRRARARMHRVSSLLPGRQMAAGISASIWRRRQVVIVVDVAVRAGCHLARRR